MLALIIGGSGSGKSEFAEHLACLLQPENKYYVATMYPWDEESKARIKKHRSMRAAKHFKTLECFYHMKETINERHTDESGEQIDTVLLECMSNLVANEMYCMEGIVNQTQNEDLVVDEIENGYRALCETYQNVIVVSNDVFSDGNEYNLDMQKYLKNLGYINVRIAKDADIVVEVVCGIPIFHKGETIYEMLME